MSDPEQVDQQERDRRTMEAVERLYDKRRAKHDTERPSPLFDVEPTERYRPDQMSRYVELMGRPPLHSDEDRAALKLRPKRRPWRRR